MVDHDRLFKELLSTFFLDFVELFLERVAEYIEKDTIVLLDKELFTDVLTGERHEVDLVVKAKFKSRDSFFLIHVENQARAEGEFARRMFRYFARLYEKYGLPVYPVAIFSYQTPKREEPSSHRVEFSDLRVMEFNFRAIQLNRLNWRDYVKRDNPVASALMSKMELRDEERPQVKLECLRILARLKLDPARTRLISGFIDTYLRLNAEEELRLRREIEKVDTVERSGIMEIVTSWMEEGLQKGLQQGLEQGLEQGLRQGLEQGLEQGREQGFQQGLLDILEVKFGDVPESLIVTIKQLSDYPLLRELHKKAVKVASLEEFQQILEGRHS